ncbi:hypothetical protein B7463_g4023, partial [Scytalidium lignicola]
MEAPQDGMTALIDAIGFLPPLPSKTLKSNDTGSAPGQSGSPHRCRLCNRVYERADHLNRHFRSHENTRPFKCDRCPKSFNRADLLTRHQAGHARHDNGELGRRRIERTDRVAEACLACIASKSKCQDEKPCARCLKKNIACTPAPGNGRGSKIQPSALDGSFQGNWSSTKTSATDSLTPNRVTTAYDNSNRSTTTNGTQNDLFDPTFHHSSTESTAFDSPSPSYNAAPNPQPNGNPPVPAYAFEGNASNQTQLFLNDSLNNISYLSRQPDLNPVLGFSPRDDYFVQDLDFSFWDLDFDSIELAYQNISNGGSQATENEMRQRSSEPSVSRRKISRRHAAFERSPWLWNPTQKDHYMNDDADLALDEEMIPSILTSDSPSNSVADFSSCYIDSKTRDKLLSLLFTLRKTPDQFPSFPSLSLLNNLIQVYFTQESFKVDQLIHIGTFNPKTAVPQLLIAIISAGCSFISIPAVWKMGLALQEIVRLATRYYWEENNSNSRELPGLQAFLIALDVGLWSGFKRKMEIAESFGHTLIVMLRRAGAFAATRNESVLIPKIEDSQSTLESKWRTWVESESFKRLVLYLFTHDVQASFGLQTPAQISIAELKLSLPASRNLWLARTAIEWRDRYLQEGHISTGIPSFISAMQNTNILYMLSSQVDVPLCTLALLHSFWSQIYHIQESKRLYPESKATYRLCILTEHGDIYRDLQDFAEKIPSLTNSSIRYSLIAELFMMSMHSSPGDLQRFAGKYGEAEASFASEEFGTWCISTDARTAIWHAGQVFKLAKRLRPAQLTNFNSIAVYYACLTLWIYGLMMSNHEGESQDQVNGRKAQPWGTLSANQVDRQKTGSNIALPQIVLNESETTQMHTFKLNGGGIPGLKISNSQNESNSEFVPLSDTNRILSLGCELYQQNFPVVDAPLPPLVDNLSALLRGLGSVPSSRVQGRAGSESLGGDT